MALELEDFAGLVGEQFTIAERPATLVSATQVGDQPGPGGRLPFSLEFVAPSADILVQAIYPVSHATLGVHDIFLVPIAQDAEGVRYEAVFT